jgi:hypothetical protein
MVIKQKDLNRNIAIIILELKKMSTQKMKTTKKSGFFLELKNTRVVISDDKGVIDVWQLNKKDTFKQFCDRFTGLREWY